MGSINDIIDALRKAPTNVDRGTLFEKLTVRFLNSTLPGSAVRDGVALDRVARWQLQTQHRIGPHGPRLTPGRTSHHSGVGASERPVRRTSNAFARDTSAAQNLNVFWRAHVTAGLRESAVLTAAFVDLRAPWC